MDFLVKIDVETIKLNPNHGSTQTVVRTKTQYKIEGFTGSIPAILNFNNFNLEYKSEGFSSSMTRWAGTLIKYDESLIEKLSHIEGVEIQRLDFTDTLNHPPIPKYSFKYQNPVITCEGCDSEIRITDLDSYADDDSYCDTVCPLCGYWINGIKYQKISDLKESDIIKHVNN